MSQEDHAPPEKLAPKRKRVLDPDEVRMSFGEHLEELRTRIIRALLGFLAGIIIAAVFAKKLLVIIYHPLLVVLAKHQLPPTLQALRVGEGFTAWIKAAMISGIILASPWVIHQMWQFVAVGLYANERRFVRLAAPASIGLFAIGIVFMYFVVLPVALDFFVTFNLDFGPPDVATGAQAVQVDPERLPRAPVLPGDPADPPIGALWFNETTGTLNFKTSDGIRSVFMPGQQQSSISPLFGLEFYLSFFMGLALAFGVAFQLPVVVVFLALLGVVSVRTMSRSRRYVIFIITIAAAILTPSTDILSMLLLALPMVGLFEIGLLIARWVERSRAKRETQEQQST
jgi:sec-independent protein translocase protein TatC